MSYQRRRGLPAIIYPLAAVVDSRGNTHRMADMNNPIKTKVWTYPQEGAKAEVIGQQEIDVVRLGSKADLGDVGLLSRVTFRGREWDIVSPPQYHHGTRHTRHWSFDVRKRP